MEIAIILLMVAMGATAFLPNNADNAERFYIAAIFAGSIIVFDLVKTLTEMTAFWFYILAAAVDSAVIFAIIGLRCITRLSKDVVIISTISIAFNAFGWYAHHKGYGDLVYRVLYLALYGWALYVLIRGEPKHDRDYQGNPWFNPVRSVFGAGHTFNNTH